MSDVERYYIGTGKTKSPIQLILDKSSLNKLANGKTREALQEVILEFLVECQWDKEIIIRELQKL